MRGPELHSISDGKGKTAGVWNGGKVLAMTI